MRSDLNLALIGNCQISALVDREGGIVWSCFPRFDADPMFCRLLEPPEGGEWRFRLIDQVSATQRYLGASAMLETELEDRQGNRLRITDFCPRYRQFGRYFKPFTIARRIEPVSGSPLVEVALSPRVNFGEAPAETTRGSNHLRFIGTDAILRLYTDAPITYLTERRPLVVREPIHFLLGPDESLRQPIAATFGELFDQTKDYWQHWVRSLALPPDYQEVIIRAAMGLKLSSFDETGAIIAAHTTSIPESPESGRNWDYRLCWLRDAYFTIRALNRLGATGTMERFLEYLIHVVERERSHVLQPLYGIGGETALTENEAPALRGYRGMGPVHIGNAAYEQIQHDVYGSAILAATQAFFDRRLQRPGDEQLFELLEHLGSQAARLWDQPDAGIWEYRGRKRVHTHSALMCWAACDRLAKIARKLEKPARAEHWHTIAERIHAGILAQSFDTEKQAFVESFGGTDLDASVLLIAELGFIAADDPRFRSTLAAAERELVRDGLLLRYAAPDDFGVPETAFTVCSFWYLDALIAVGRRDEASELLAKLLHYRSDAGLLSEDISTETGELWGNYPQTYSLVGLINAAVQLSRSWDEVL